MCENITPGVGKFEGERMSAVTMGGTITITKNSWNDPLPLHPQLAMFGRCLIDDATLEFKRLPFHILEDIMCRVNELGKKMVSGEIPSDVARCKEFALYAMKIEANGCGPHGWKCGIVKQLDRPWWMFGRLTLRKACIGHDILYAIGGNEIRRLWADNWLHDDIVWRCRRRFTSLWSSAIKAVGYATAHGFLVAVRGGGDSCFNMWSRNYLEVK